MRIGIIGGGPAGAEAARLLAKEGNEVLLFERKTSWEKPCGGGITPKTFRLSPHLKSKELPGREIERITFIAPSGRRATISLREPLFIVSRKALFRFQLKRAEEEGAKLIQDEIKNIEQKDKSWLLIGKEGYEVDILIGADGIKSIVRRKLRGKFRPGELGFALVSFPYGDFPPEIIIRFLSSPPGYLWWFPRIGHASAGICTPLIGKGKGLEKLLQKFLKEETPERGEEKGKPISFLTPFLQKGNSSKLYGENWALIGDAAGLADPLTGEGIYPALLSAHLISRAIKEGNISAYGEYLREKLIPEIESAYRIRRFFFSSKVLELGVSLLAKSKASAEIFSELTSGELTYRELKGRVLSTLPQAAKEFISLIYSGR
ncbi:MAG: NAD(P)/FAD-dependent oxidoreductase [Acidobacteria bacterium]|nr:NAD(P)/FAD-dependent oxidoreductase [Acidobacteriota bacterium]